MASGTVRFFHDRKGYGFIETDDADDDIFFHVDDLGGEEPQEGQQVTFDIEQAPRGPRAKNIEFA